MNTEFKLKLLGALDDFASIVEIKNVVIRYEKLPNSSQTKFNDIIVKGEVQSISKGILNSKDIECIEEGQSLFDIKCELVELKIAFRDSDPTLNSYVWDIPNSIGTMCVASDFSYQFNIDLPTNSFIEIYLLSNKKILFQPIFIKDCDGHVVCDDQGNYYIKGIHLKPTEDIANKMMVEKFKSIETIVEESKLILEKIKTLKRKIQYFGFGYLVLLILLSYLLISYR